MIHVLFMVMMKFWENSGNDKIAKSLDGNIGVFLFVVPWLALLQGK
jgi:hypothetical protein